MMRMQIGWACVGGILLSVVGLCSLPAQGSDGGCLEAEAALYIATAGAEQGTLEVTQYWGEEAAMLEVTARLHTNLPGKYGVSGWALSVKHDPAVLEILDATHDGTDADDLCPLQTVEIIGNESGAGFVTAVVMFCDPRMHNWPPVGDFSLVRARYRVVFPDVRPPSASQGHTRETTIRFEDGLQGDGSPTFNVLTYQGVSLRACAESLNVEVEFVETREFIRGDANYDLQLDISDPVTILHAKFYGDLKIRCEAAADSNNDGTVDISDAAYIFNYLFLGGSRPAPPFPEPGLDPEPGGLLCRP